MPGTFTDIVWPMTRHYWLADARVPACMLTDGTAPPMPVDSEGVVNADLLIDDGRLVRARSGYRSSSEGHRLQDNHTSGSRS
jgi:hypothetical protein